MTKNDEAPSNDSILEEAKEYWIELARTAVRDSLSTIESTAHQIVTLVGVLIGLYSGAVTVSTIRSQKLEYWLLVLVLCPIVFWLISLMAALGVFWPSKYVINIQSAVSAKETMESLMRKKNNRLQASFVFLLAGIILLIIALGTYLLV